MNAVAALAGSEAENAMILAVNIIGTASAETLAQCLAATEQCTIAHALPESDAYAVRLAVDGACTNLVEHAYAGQAPGYMALEIWLDVAAPATPTQVHIRIRDQAPPFDPTTIATPDVDAPLEDRRIGGLGWFFIHEMMQQVKYQTLPNGFNELQMRRVCSAVPTPENSNSPQKQ